jgi:hypothetical protein
MGPVFHVAYVTVLNAIHSYDSKAGPLRAEDLEVCSGPVVWQKPIEPKPNRLRRRVSCNMPRRAGLALPATGLDGPYTAEEWHD